MKIGSLIKLIEDLIFELLSWVLFIPKTLILANRPGASYNYVASEWEKPDDERYSPTLSPIMFYLAMILAGVLEVGWALGVPPRDYLDHMLKLSELDLVGLFVGALLLPLFYSIVLQLILWRRTKETITRKSLRKIFDLQCLYWGAFVIYGLVLGVMTNIPFLGNLVGQYPLLFLSILPLTYIGWLETGTFKGGFELKPVYAFLLGAGIAFCVQFLVDLLIGDIYAPLTRLFVP